jgi:ketosteroid isomerase-like protein
MPSDDDRDKQQIAQLIAGMFSSFAEHKPDSIEHCLAETCTVWDVFQPELIEGKADRLKFHQADQEQSQKRGKLTYSLTPPTIDVWDDTALARYYLTFEYESPNETLGRVRITDVLRRTNGRWLIVHHHEGMTPAGVPHRDHVNDDHFEA